MTVISVNDLSFRYPDGATALKGISFSVDVGERVALIGPNGAGKSTLLLHLNGILRGTGEVRVGDLPVCEKNLREIRKRVGLVFQNPDHQLFMPTVFDDVAFGPLANGISQQDAACRVAAALAAVGMKGSEGRMCHHLSFGEKKRVSLATVLVMDPEVLVLDEPSSNLDPRSRRGLITLLSGMRHSLVLATHDLEMVRELCTRCVLLDNGRIVAHGTVPDMFADRDVLTAHGLEIPASLSGCS